MAGIGPRVKLLAPELGAIACAVAWFFYLNYGATLDPTFVSWMWREDWAAYQWGFSFFRNAPWAWPLGNIPNLFYPYGTSVGFTDANPWVCVLLKLISPLLPVDFQFSGLWFLLCFVLQALFGCQISRTITRDPLQVALGGALFAVTPVLPVRARHVALCALFFATAGLWLNLKRVESEQTLQRDLRLSWLLLAWAAGTHGYLSVMLLGLCVAFYARLYLVDARIDGRRFALCLSVAFGLTLSIYYLFGLIGWKPMDLSIPGFGLYSADFSTLFNPMGLSRLMPALPVQPAQWEGFAYLGLGVLALLALFALRFALDPLPWLRALRGQWPLLLVLLASFVYALSDKITWRGVLLADLSTLYAPLSQLTGTFRSSGRFAWLAHLALIALAIRAAHLPAYPSLSRALLALALALSVAEQQTSQYQFPEMPLYQFSTPALRGSGRDYDHLELVPLQLQWECFYSDPFVNALSYLAYRERLTFNSGNFMRKPPGAQALCRHEPNVLDPRTIYVVTPDRVAAMRGRGAECGKIEGLDMCVAAGRQTPFAHALLESIPGTP
jgi:hypothetical protein